MEHELVELSVAQGKHDGSMMRPPRPPLVREVYVELAREYDGAYWQAYAQTVIELHKNGRCKP